MSYSVNLAKLADASVITRLLNKVTLDLLEKGERQWSYPWRLPVVQKAIGLGHIYIVTEETKLVAAFFLETVTELPGFFLTEKSLYLSKMAVLPSQQGQDYGQLILNYCREVSLTHGLAVYLECSVTNDALNQFFVGSNCHSLGQVANLELFKLTL